MNKVSLYSAAILLVASVISSSAENGTSTKPVIFLTSPPPTPTTNSSDNGKSESRVNEKIAPEGTLDAQGSVKQAVASSGYQLEVIDDDTEEAQERAESENPKQIGGLYPPGVVNQPSVLNQFLHTPDYDENSAKEDGKDEYPRKFTYGDSVPKTDISKIRDIFVGKEVVGGNSHLPSPSANPAYPASAPLESKYKFEYETPIKYVNSPILLKASPLAAPHLSHPHGLLEPEVIGHTAGYGHGYHHHQQKLKAKPLKPSVVYRDPSDRFDHHDKIRTLDKDHLGGAEKDSRHPYGPHVIEKDHHGFHDYHHGKKEILEPTHYDQSKIPECAHKNKYIYNLTFCLDDPHYPVEPILWAIKEAGPHAKKLLSDVTYQSADNLVSGLTRAEEEGYTYKHYFGASHSQNIHLDKYKPPYQGYTYSTDYFKKGGYICPSDIYYARPKRAMNTFGKWKVIVNIDHEFISGNHGYGEGHYIKGHGHDGGHYQKGHHGQGEGHYIKGHEHGEGHYNKGHHGHGDDHYNKGHGHEEGHYIKGHGHGEGHYIKGHGHGEEHGRDGHYGKGHDEHGHGWESYGPEHSIKKREYKEIKKSYTQTLRLEQCIYPNAPCSYVDSHFHSSCIQKHNFVRLVAWTHKEGIHVDTFKMPIACSCHVRQPIHFYHESGHHQHKHGHVVPPVSSYHGPPPHPHHAEPHHNVLKKVY